MPQRPGRFAASWRSRSKSLFISSGSSSERTSLVLSRITSPIFLVMASAASGLRGIHLERTRTDYSSSDRRRWRRFNMTRPGMVSCSIEDICATKMVVNSVAWTRCRVVCESSKFGQRPAMGRSLTAFAEQRPSHGPACPARARQSALLVCEDAHGADVGLIQSVRGI